MDNAPNLDERIEQLVTLHEEDVEMLIPMMQDLQTECGYLPAPHLRRLARRLKVSLARVYQVATFYASFRLMPKGEHTVTLCMGTVCYLKGADKIAEALQRELQMKPGETSPDGKFTFAPVNCLGACALAPVMIVDKEYFGHLTPDTAVSILRRIASGEAVAGEERAGGPTSPEPMPKAASNDSRRRPSRPRKTDPASTNDHGPQQAKT